MVNIKEHHYPGYESVIEGKDAASGLHCLIAVHNTHLGPALGGTRMYPYASREEAMTDVLRLSEGMTYKSAVAGIGLGGGKSVILGDPKKDKSPELLRAFGRVVDTLKGRYICAEDMGTTTADMDEIRRGTEFVVGLDLIGSSGNPAPFTAWGVYRGLQSVSQELFRTDSLKGKRVGIVGLGAVGKRLADRLFWDGAELVLGDVDRELAQRMGKQYGAEVLPPEEALLAECDILSPCAVGGMLNPTTISQLRCRAIAGAANNQLLQVSDGDLLKERGILYAPDFVINAGGIINVAFELESQGYEAKKAKEKVDGIYVTLGEIYQLAKEQGVATSEAADLLAKRKVEKREGKRKAEVCFHR